MLHHLQADMLCLVTRSTLGPQHFDHASSNIFDSMTGVVWLLIVFMLIGAVTTKAKSLGGYNLNGVSLVSFVLTRSSQSSPSPS